MASNHNNYTSELINYLNSQMQLHKVGDAIIILPNNWQHNDLKSEGYKVLHHKQQKLKNNDDYINDEFDVDNTDIYYLIKNIKSKINTSSNTSSKFKKIKKWLSKSKNKKLQSLDSYTHSTNNNIEQTQDNIIFENKINNYLNVLSDISHHLDLNNTTDEIKFFNKKFLQNLGHQIKTPISGVLSGIKLLETTFNNNPHNKQIFSSLYTSCCELATYLNNLLDYYLFTEKKIQLEYTNCKIYNYMNEILDYYSKYNKRPELNLNVNLNFIYNHPQNLEINIDIKRMRQVIMNILDNSFKYTNTGNILVMFEYNTNNYIIKILDTGCGINPYNRDKIFYPFYNLVIQNTNDKYDGMGISLAISKKIIELMGGEIKITEPEIANYNTQFNIIIPLNKNLNFNQIIQNLDIIDNAKENDLTFSKTIASNLTLPQFEKVRDDNETTLSIIKKQHINILIIDDNITNNQLNKAIINSILNKFNVNNTIKIINNSCLAIKEILTYSCDIIFLDLKMPVVSGIQILKELKNIKYFQNKDQAKIYIITALQGYLEELNNLQLPNIEIIQKPILYETFQNLLLNYLCPITNI
jgi:signal transduction histidine kinase/CheY-like chemotaxis protein